MKVVAILPPSEQVQAQAAMVRALFSGHTVELATNADELAPHLPDSEVLISTAFTPLTREMLQSAARLRFIQVAGVGVDHVDLDAAQALGITVAAVTGANTVSVAEHVAMVALALIKGLIPAHNMLAQGQWSLPYWIAHARDIQGKTIGIIGMGRIGRETAARLLPFGVTTFYYDVNPLPPEQEEQLGATYLELDALLPECDMITLHMPLAPETRGLFNRERLFSMKPGAFLINTARAELIDEAALIEALQGHLGGAAIDVFAPEPPLPDHPLLKLPNVILTPHGAGVTQEAQQRIAQGVIQNVLRFLEGRPLADVVVQGTR
ncbi:MAG: NAD-dependent formate dehydrogenase [Fimbriimonadales bacterium]|nr:MAG: NAD-dependent formate dehydrogenase [Fimbriimonadales bacterium]GIV10166.1 MAG: NAD-dependent formate dehydrogenase [Fimbriimonadales bacterium]